MGSLFFQDHAAKVVESGMSPLQRSVSRKGSRRGSRTASKERKPEQNRAKAEVDKNSNPHGAGEALKGPGYHKVTKFEIVV